MTDPGKKMINPLFSNAVTGSTFEDFSQNAILLPAKERTPPPLPVLNVPQEQPVSLHGAQFSGFPEPLNAAEIAGQPSFFQQPQPQQEQQINFFQDTTSASSNLTSSVLSSFTNLLNLTGQRNQSVPEPELEVAVAPPAGIADLISQGNSEQVAPVPLFSADSASLLVNKAPPSSQGSQNTFRGSGLKRPVYAQIPGLSSNNPAQKQSAQTLVDNNPILRTAAPIAQPFIPPSQPLIPTNQPFAAISQPFTPTTQPFAPTSTTSAVMAAISPSEVLQSSPEVITEENSETKNVVSNQPYRPVYQHWFYSITAKEKTQWEPFSMVDSLALEGAFVSNDLDPDKVVATDGGRYDVNILRRQRIPVYWKGSPNEVRRCSWFYKGNSDGRCVPYEENVATKLEDEYRQSFETGRWHRRIELANGDAVVFHSPDVLVLYPPPAQPDNWGNAAPAQPKPRVVKRGMDEFDIDEGESSEVDHLLFMVHGIGSVCDLKFRTVEEVVNDFRSTSLQLVRTHYKSSCDRGLAHRVEVLPISWHDELHSAESGIDDKLKSITLDSIPILRAFTNDTLLDIFFYTSPVYCQKIISTVGNQLNSVYELFKKRNPNFTGDVSLGGHSLGSLILFDLLSYQKNHETDTLSENGDDTTALRGTPPPPTQRRMSKRISYMMSTMGTGQPYINYPHLNFHPKALFALGSPIGMFVMVRGLDGLGEDFSLPTCPAFFNIFHPYDPVAYRIESLINPELAQLQPSLIPHHKGRKRMHLELKETMARVGADLKQKVIDSMKSTWNSFYQLAMFHRPDQPSIEDEMNSAIKKQLESEDQLIDHPEQQPTDLALGTLNRGRRIDYVLQEAPFELLTGYLFAVTSHVCYWDSEDTMLLILKEIYSNMNVTPDDKIPQQSMTIERTVASGQTTFPANQSAGASGTSLGMDPTMPLQKSTNVGPPPVSGFVKKT